MRLNAFLLSVILLTFVATPSHSTKKQIQTYEAGKLKSMINKSEYAEITDLSITGYVSDKDMKVIGSLINLETLDLRYAVCSNTFFPRLDKLSTLYLSVNGNYENYKKSKGVEVYAYSYIPQFKNLRQIFAKRSVMKHLSNIPTLTTVGLYDDWFIEEKNSVKIDTLVIWDDNCDNFYVKKNYGGFIPNIIINAVTGESILPYYDASRKDYKGINILPNPNSVENRKLVQTPRILDLSDVRVIPNDYFAKAEMDSIVFSTNLRYIGSHAFYKCPNLTRATFKNKECRLTIDNSFYDSNVKYFHFQGPVFFSCSKAEYCTYIFDAPSVIKLRPCKYSNFVFNSRPEEIEWETAENNVVFSPKGELDYYSHLFGGKKYEFLVVEQGHDTKSYNIKMERPGTILSYLPIKELLYIDSLTITGTLYETDLEVIEQCKMLRYLDISRTYFTSSPEKRKQEREDAEQWRALFGLIGNMADVKYNNFEMTSEDYIFTKLFAELAKQSSDVKDTKKLSFGLRGAFCNMQFLQEVVMPYRAKTITNCFNDCLRLRKVKLPLYVEYVSGFNRCFSLSDIDFPSTINGIKGFTHCHTFEKIDLSHLTFKVNYNKETLWEHAFNDCASLRELRLPQGITHCYNWFSYDLSSDIPMKIYFPNTLQYVSNNCFDNKELHFASRTAPSGSFDIRGKCVIYCPKGCVTSYYNAISISDRDKVEFIEE